MIRAFVLYESGAGRRTVRAARRALPAGSGRHVPARAGYSAPHGRAEVRATTPSGSSRTWTRSGPRRVAGVRCGGQGRDGARIPFTGALRRTSSMSEPDAPRRSRPTELGFERSSTRRRRRGDDPAEPARGAECVRLPDAARDRPRVRGRVVGRRDPRRRGHRHRPGVLRRCRPEAWGATRREARASTGSGSAPSRTCTTALREIGKPTVARIKGIAVGGGNELQMACDLAVMVDDAFIRHVGLEHGRCRPAGRRSGCRSWSATAAPRDHHAV